MIFAHAPAGFSIAYLLKKYWQKNLSKKQIKWMYFFVVLGGLFPDIDLFYYYFASAAKSHREMITHSFFIYLVIFLILFLIFYFLKNSFLQKLNIIFFIGLASHLITDSIGSGIMWLYPINKNLYGLGYFLQDSFLNNYYFTINYYLESFFYFLLFLILIKNFINKKIIKNILYIVLTIGFIGFFFVLIFINQNLFCGNPQDIYYSDIDKDKILNNKDLDLDGDGILNIDDLDIDNNEVSNREEMKIMTQKNINNFYDFTEGGVIEIPLRMGLVTNSDLIRRLFDNIGIFLKIEMAKDYEENYKDYASSPLIKDFDRNPENWLAYLKHQNKLKETEQDIEEFDILFFKDNYVALALGTTGEEDYVLEASPEQKKVIKTTLKDLINRQGEILYIGKLLP